MKSLVFSLFLICFILHPLYPQLYFVPKVGGLVNVHDGKNYYVIDIPGKDSAYIYTMIKQRISRYYNDPEKTIVSDVPNKYIKLYGTQPNSIGKGPYVIDFIYNIDIDIRNERYRFYFSDAKLQRVTIDNEIVNLVMENGQNKRSGGGNIKFLFTNNSVAPEFYPEYKDFIKWLDIISVIMDIRKADTSMDDW